MGRNLVAEHMETESYPKSAAGSPSICDYRPPTAWGELVQVHF